MTLLYIDSNIDNNALLSSIGNYREFSVKVQQRQDKNEAPDMHRTLACGRPHILAVSKHPLEQENGNFFGL